MVEEKQKSVEDKDLVKEQDDYLDEALKGTFPASDPISPGHAEQKHPNVSSGNKPLKSFSYPAANSDL